MINKIAGKDKMYYFITEKRTCSEKQNGVINFLGLFSTAQKIKAEKGSWIKASNELNS